MTVIFKRNTYPWFFEVKDRVDWTHGCFVGWCKLCTANAREAIHGKLLYA